MIGVPSRVGAQLLVKICFQLSSDSRQQTPAILTNTHRFVAYNSIDIFTVYPRRDIDSGVALYPKHTAGYPWNQSKLDGLLKKDICTVHEEINIYTKLKVQTRSQDADLEQRGRELIYHLATV